MIISDKQNLTARMCIKRCSLPQGFTCLKLQNNCLWEVGVVGDGGGSTPDFFRSFQDWQFPLVSYLRWPFPAERLRKMFLQNKTWMDIRTLRYIITPEGQSWRRFLATQFTLIFEVEVFLWRLSWKVWNTCEVRRKQRNS